ncbi:DUF3822 family protein [Sphingobacterium sp. Mn56C]|uniref:DUF3822 family protein n=1 Tax=Sphingobacterium sp. Mn56C TaxID=3395261 RepID=UPI003BC19EF6
MIYTSSDFFIPYLPDYTLYIKSDVHNDQLVVVDAAGRVLVYRSYASAEPTAEALKILSLPFQQVQISLPQQGLIWVPQEVYDVTEKALYTDYFVDEHIDSIGVQEIDALSAVALYQYDLYLYNRWKSLFPTAHFTPIFSVFIQQLGTDIPKNGAFMGIHRYDDQADIILFVDGEFKLYNTFEVNTIDDLCYFVLSLFRNFHIREKIAGIALSAVASDSEWIQRLQRYAETVYLLKPMQQWFAEDEAVAKKIEELNVLTDSTRCV